MKKKTALQLALATALMAIAALLISRFVRQQREPEGMAYFYDLSEKKLFIAPRTSVPPIRGINDDREDAVRAVVISTNGNIKDKAAQKIAYLEMYSPELKRQFENTRAGAANGPFPAISHSSAQAHILVRRIDDSNWYSANSAEAQKIMTEWQKTGPDGKIPAVCVP